MALALDGLWRGWSRKACFMLRSQMETDAKSFEFVGTKIEMGMLDL